MAVASAAACNNCRRWMLRSFIASMGGPAINVHRRAFSAATPRRLENSSLEQDKPAPILGSQPATQETHVPWYLQKLPGIPSQDAAPASLRQRIPDLPENPPPILQPLLERISVDLGMDDLNILDLRTIDPPPALGANLLMVVGTARSEKHLHVSADRLCRWLRTEYKLTPFADGLLGRNELKLRVRRLTKKKKLLAAVGGDLSADDEGADNGIRTGWICVNIGRVKGGEPPQTAEDLERQAKVIGFGTGVTGSNIVVQLLTEEKRSEIELERLWTTMIQKNEKQRAKLLAASAEGDASGLDMGTSGSEDVDETSGVPKPRAAYMPFSQESMRTTKQRVREEESS